jgi:very-short-patch-repair endonuclease
MRIKIENKNTTMKTVKQIEINGIAIPTRYVAPLPYNESLKERARKLRSSSTLSEVLFWMQVHKRKFFGIDFDRQKVIGNYIVDFFVESLGLVIEIDGKVHEIQEEYDERRSWYLESLGLTVLRISNDRVLFSMGSVLVNLRDFIVERFGVL